MFRGLQKHESLTFWKLVIELPLTQLELIFLHSELKKKKRMGNEDEPKPREM